MVKNTIFEYMWSFIHSRISPPLCTKKKARIIPKEVGTILVFLFVSFSIQAQTISGSVKIDGNQIDYKFSPDSISINANFTPKTKVVLNGVEQKLDTAIFEHKVNLDEVQYIIFTDDYDSAGVMKKRRYRYKFDSEEPY